MNILSLIADELCTFSNPKRNRTILPTGEWKLEGSIVLFEANVIVHRPCGGVGVGLGVEWFVIPEKYTGLI